MSKQNNGMIPWGSAREPQVLSSRDVSQTRSSGVGELAAVSPVVDLVPPGSGVGVDALWRHKWKLVLGMLVCSSAAALISLYQTPTYRARTTVEINSVNENLLNLKDVDPYAAAGPAGADVSIDNYIEIAQSRSLIRSTVARLGLEGAYAQQPQRWYAPWLAAVGLRAPAAEPAREQAIGAVAGSLTVRSRGTRLIELLYDSTDPALAAKVLNTLTSEWIEWNLDSRWKRSQRTSDWLVGHVAELRQRLEDSQDKLQAYARNSGLMFVSEKHSVAEEKLQQLQAELSRAQAERVAKQSSYEIAKALPAESLPGVLDSGLLRDVQSKRTDLGRQLAEAQTLLTPSHYKVKQLQAQVAELDAALGRERSGIMSRIENEYESARRREQLLTKAYTNHAALVSDAAAKAVHYDVLKREVETNGQLYGSILQKVRESGIASAIRASNIQVLDPAEIPARPFKPNIAVNSLLGATSGLLLAALLVFVRERSDRSFRAPGDVSNFLQLPELGIIPSGADQLRLNGNRVELASWKQRPSLVAESFRATLASILVSVDARDRSTVLLLTSPGPGEGKTTVSTNLAIALARTGREVLLIDADLRKPRVHEIFGLSNDAGLSDLLRAENPVAEIERRPLCQATELPGLHVLTSGQGDEETLDLLSRRRIQELLAQFRSEFDAVIIDTPPVMHLADARVLGRLADAVVLVVRAGETNRDQAMAARRRLAEDGIPLLGTILNDWNPDSLGYTANYSYYAKTAGAGKKT
jgi:polysaccharide biosynthesis transport protein